VIVPWRATVWLIETNVGQRFRRCENLDERKHKLANMLEARQCVVHQLPKPAACRTGTIKMRLAFAVGLFVGTVAQNQSCVGSIPPAHLGQRVNEMLNHYTNP